MSVRFHNTSQRVLAVAEDFKPDGLTRFVTLDLRFYSFDGKSEEELSLLLAPDALAVIKAAIDGIVPAGGAPLPYLYPDPPEAAKEPPDSSADESPGPEPEAPQDGATAKEPASEDDPVPF